MCVRTVLWGGGGVGAHEVGVAVSVHPAADVRAELGAGQDAAEHLDHHRQSVALVAACVPHVLAYTYSAVLYSTALLLFYSAPGAADWTQKLQ